MHDLVQVDVCREADRTLLVVSGEIDAATAHLVHSALDDFDMHERIVVDMAAVEFMDSSGLHVFLNHAMRMNEGDGSLHIRNPSSSVERLLDVSGLREVFS